ncbi:hypothetical protein F4778DRAFT_453623 [Xylariomycetidae sp. FL2044]|nr:hypothetical protein F4778DRAFT_453623 [Xylariomycetidae sp. FL2044]
MGLSVMGAGIIKLQTFNVSSQDFDETLSASSVAYVYEPPSSPQYLSSSSSEPVADLLERVMTKRLWLQSPGFCRLEIVVDECEPFTTNDLSDNPFLDFLASAICSCPVWHSLGLEVSRDYDDLPHSQDGTSYLSFNIQHPDKSSALLSPSHLPIALFDGVECKFSFKSDTTGADHVNDDVFQAHQHRQHAVLLTYKALYTLTGVKKHFSRIRIEQVESHPSLLALAPSVWNANHLRVTATHAKQLPKLATILSSSIHGQSPALRQRAAELLEEPENDGSAVRGEQPGEAASAREKITEKLWNLVQVSLDPSIRPRIKSSTKPRHSSLPDGNTTRSEPRGQAQEVQDHGHHEVDWPAEDAYPAAAMHDWEHESPYIDSQGSEYPYPEETVQEGLDDFTQSSTDSARSWPTSMSFHDNTMSYLPNLEQGQYFMGYGHGEGDMMDACTPAHFYGYEDEDTMHTYTPAHFDEYEEDSMDTHAEAHFEGLIGESEPGHDIASEDEMEEHNWTEQDMAELYDR